MANLLGKGQSTVSYWVKTGIIPAKWHASIIELANKNGILLTFDDFVQIDQNSSKTSTVESFVKDVEAAVKEPMRADFIFYSIGDGAVKIQIAVGDETVWASQSGMADIFDVETNTIVYHLKNIFESSELDEKSVVRKIRVTASDNKNYEVNYYSLDAIISVGYRVNSYYATQFRKWATTVLKEYLVKGFVLNDDRLKQGANLFGKDYFDELLERIREIRASERRFYQKITDIYAQCSIDYDKNSPITQKFYAHVQDKLHYAIHGHTAAELIELRADADKPNMGLQSYKNSGKKGKVTRSDVVVGKNYLNQEELQEMNRLVSMYLDMAESFARRHKQMFMKDWAERLDGFLEFNGYDVLENYGTVKREIAERHALAEFEKFRIKQDIEYVSDFDEIVDSVKTKMKLPRNSH